MIIENIMNRFKEPSSYSAIAAVLAMGGIIMPNPMWQTICLIGCGVAGIAGFWMSENKK
jgi:hypothetical protein|tara:strand:+ start:381 stop:557 length:177 start_codon:yes stop_codon:yes gene_type:complete